MLIIAIYAVRAASKLFHIGEDFSFVQFNGPQAFAILALMFLSMAWNFGFLLMAIDRLRNEVADLALMDDLEDLFEGNKKRILGKAWKNSLLAPGEHFLVSRITPSLGADLHTGALPWPTQSQLFPSSKYQPCGHIRFA